MNQVDPILNKVILKLMPRLADGETGDDMDSKTATQLLEDMVVDYALGDIPEGSTCRSAEEFLGVLEKLPAQHRCFKEDYEKIHHKVNVTRDAIKQVTRVANVLGEEPEWLSDGINAALCHIHQEIFRPGLSLRDLPTVDDSLLDPPPIGMGSKTAKALEEMDRLYEETKEITQRRSTVTDDLPIPQASEEYDREYVREFSRVTKLGLSSSSIFDHMARWGKFADVFFFDPNDESSLKPLKQGQAAFPDLDYAGPLAPLENSRHPGRRIRGMQTILYGRGYREVVEEMRHSALGISEQMIWLENNINELVCAYKDKPDSSLAEQVFHKIQLWGGTPGMNIYIRKGGFRNNFSIRKYEAMVRCLLDGIKEGPEAVELSRALIVDDFRIPFLGVSFATKHFRFWSGGRLPIFDNQMAKGIFGEGANWKRYPHYVRCMIDAAGQKGVEVSVLERKLFNYFQSPKALTLPPRNLRQKLTPRERFMKELMDL